MQEEKVAYTLGKKEMQGTLVYDPTVKGKRPGVVVAHAWMGQDDFARRKAHELAQLGYVAFAADVYGNGRTATNGQEAEKLMTPLFLNRRELRGRIVAAYETLRNAPGVDQERMGAIGFCFGGLTAIELFRSGVPLRGVVSFHGILANARGEVKAETLPIAPNITGSLLILHGFEDPLVSKEDLEAIQSEMTAAKVDWQIHLYGHTVHAFTNPAVTDFKSGFCFNEKASKRSWTTMRNFFEEVFV